MIWRSLISYGLASISSLAIATNSLSINLTQAEVTPTEPNTELPDSPNRLQIAVSVDGPEDLK
ncbi:MAG: hypothetical protein F6K24_31140, partial [Okeania sp. SIO2D1]|nr:hypothetical protein [Okeania sp. SIO2D1]